MKTLDALAFQMAGSSRWDLRWVLIDTDTEEIFPFKEKACNISGFCGMLSGDNPTIELDFDRNGLIRSYFRVLDPISNSCVGTARCLKKTAHLIVAIQENVTI